MAGLRGGEVREGWVDEEKEGERGESCEVGEGWIERGEREEGCEVERWGRGGWRERERDGERR